MGILQKYNWSYILFSLQIVFETNTSNQIHCYWVVNFSRLDQINFISTIFSKFKNYHLSKDNIIDYLWLSDSSRIKKQWERKTSRKYTITQLYIKQVSNNRDIYLCSKYIKSIFQNLILVRREINKTERDEYQAVGLTAVEENHTRHHVLHHNNLINKGDETFSVSFQL